MTTHSNIDDSTKDILKHSLLELTDPRFHETTMKKIMRVSRRRRLFDNIYLGSLIFIAIDTLIALALWMTHLNIVDVAFHFVNVPEKLIPPTEQLEKIILSNGFLQYSFLIFAVLMAALLFIESKFHGFEKPKQRGN
ncbi:MAG TPA: hypothetical protein VMU30_01670 [Bacteroidota bacterium]|nr:hypothetical protein [Bacteroidota bacterium]